MPAETSSSRRTSGVMFFVLIAALTAVHLARQYWTEHWVGVPLLEWSALGLALWGIALHRRI